MIFKKEVGELMADKVVNLYKPGWNIITVFINMVIQNTKELLLLSEWTKIILINLLWIVILNVSSIGMVFYEQWYLKQYPFPICMTAFNHLLKFGMAGIFRIAYDSATGNKRVSLTWKQYFTVMALLGAIAAFHATFLNLSLNVNSVSLYTVSGIASLVFILILVLISRLEKFNWNMLIIVILIAVGMGLFTYESSQIHLIGVIVALIAAFANGVRLTSVQYIFEKTNFGIKDPMDFTFYISIWVFFLVLPVAVIVEGKDIYHKYNVVGNHIIATAVMCAVTSFCTDVSRYIVLKRTSSLTVTVLQMAKDIATLVLAHFRLNDQMSIVNFAGLVLCITGVISHSTYKYMKGKRKHLQDTEDINETINDPVPVPDLENYANLEATSYISVYVIDKPEKCHCIISRSSN